MKLARRWNRRAASSKTRRKATKDFIRRGLLAERLKGEGVHVAEVIIGGGVKGTATAGDQGIDPADIAEAFWRLYQGRSEIRARVP